MVFITGRGGVWGEGGPADPLSIRFATTTSGLVNTAPVDSAITNSEYHKIPQINLND